MCLFNKQSVDIWDAICKPNPSQTVFFFILKLITAKELKTHYY